jgi:hypothetical protein
MVYTPKDIRYKGVNIQKRTIWVNEGSYFVPSDFMVMENSNETSCDLLMHHSKNY